MSKCVDFNKACRDKNLSRTEKKQFKKYLQAEVSNWQRLSSGEITKLIKTWEFSQKS